MNLTPAQRRDIRRWTHANERARRAYEAEPIASRFVNDAADCAMPYCPRPVQAAGLCWRHLRLHKRNRGEDGAA